MLFILSEQVAYINSYYIRHNYHSISSKSYASKIDNTVVQPNKLSSIKLLNKLTPCISALCSLIFFNVPNSFAVNNIDPTATTTITTSTTTNQITNKQPVSLSSGVQYYDLREGTEGTIPVENGRTVQFLWSLRRSNGYFVDSSANYDNEPFIYKVGNLKKVIKGIDTGIQGMKAGEQLKVFIRLNT